MKTIAELKKEKESKVTDLIKESKMFFAFSNEQFATNKVQLADGDKYIDAGSGCFLPKSKVDTYLKGLKSIDKWYKDAVKSNKAREANILYELSNYECFYTYDISEAVSALGAGYTYSEVKAVFNKNVNLQDA